MDCQDVAFAQGICRISISDRTTHPGMPLFVARMWLFDEAESTLHPIVIDGRVAEVHAGTEALALNSAITFLERHLGGLSEYPHGCLEIDGPPHYGSPITLSESPTEART